MRKIQLMKPWISDAEKQAVQDVMDGGWLTEGEKVAEFEEAIAKYIGVKHAIVVPNATIGLELLMNLVVPCKSTVCVPAFSHPATMLAPLRSSQVVCFCDVSLKTGNVTPYEFENAVQNVDFDSVIPVSWGGNPLSPYFYASAREYGIRVIEDAACSLGAIDSSGSKTGSQAYATVFSFHPRKVITTGEGGVIVTNHDSLAGSLRRVKNFGSPGFYAGTNAKLSDINASIGLCQLDRIDQIISNRRDLAHRYDLLCDGSGILWDVPSSIGERVFQSYCAYVPHRDRLIYDLAGLGIETQIGTYYLPSCPSRGQDVSFPDALSLSRHLLTLPLHHEITEEDQEFVVQSIADLLRSYNV